MIEEEVAELRSAATDFATSYGTDVAQELHSDSEAVLLWLGYLRDSKATGTANSCLDGVQGALIEAIACSSLGVFRPSLYAMRAQIDLILAWWYFRDHPVEWGRVEYEGKGFKMKKDLLAYLGDFTPNFNRRYAILRRRSELECEDPYQVLSAHIHCQSNYVTPSIGPLSSVVGDYGKLQECRKLQAAVTEYVNDVCMAVLGNQWLSLPEKLRKDVERRLSSNEKTVVFG